jgi:hypothetical protein
MIQPRFDVDEKDERGPRTSGDTTLNLVGATPAFRFAGNQTRKEIK